MHQLFTIVEVPNLAVVGSIALRKHHKDSVDAVMIAGMH